MTDQQPTHSIERTFTEQTRDSTRRRILTMGGLGLAVGGAGLVAPTPAQAAPSRTADTVYDVTQWKRRGKHPATAHQDLGIVINEIIAGIRADRKRETQRAGAAILIPPGHYDLRTPVKVDISYLTIMGFGHGFYSRSIASNSDTRGWVDLEPGASHVRVLCDGPAFVVSRDGAPRLSSVEFRDFCLDGVSFKPDENSYRNGKTGIHVASDNDSFWVTGMGFVYLEHALVVRGADALKISDNMIAECGNCVELTGAGQATVVCDNLMGAGPEGVTLSAENHEGLLVSGNNLFPRGRSIVEFHTCMRSSLTGNRLQGFFPGMVRLLGGCKENLIGANHFRRASEGYPPFLGISNGLDDLYGVLHIEGDNNLVNGNIFAFDVPPHGITPVGADVTMILIASGDSNVLAANHVVSNVASQHVVVDGSASATVVMDSGQDTQITDYSGRARIRYTP